MSYPVFDLHCDTSLVMAGHNFFAEGTLRSNSFHVDLERAGVYDAYAQCFAVFTTSLGSLPGNMTVEDAFERRLSVLLREFGANQDLIRQVYCAEDIEKNRQEGIMSAILTLEGTAGFGYDPELLENLHDIGFLITSLGWNESNPLVGSHRSGEGLSDLGRAYVREAQRLGMRIDVSHISDQGFWDIMDITQAPVIATHSNSRRLCNNSRNITDDMFLQICRTGGVVGINQYADFLGDAPTLDTVCDHIFHFLELDPTGKHISLGGDLDGIERSAEGFEGIQSYSALGDRLVERGLSREQVLDIFWNNAFGVI